MVINESLLFHWECNRIFLKENIFYLIRVTFRIYEVMCRFLIISLLWVAAGGYICGFYLCWIIIDCFIFMHLGFADFSNCRDGMCCLCDFYFFLFVFFLHVSLILSVRLCHKPKQATYILKHTHTHTQIKCTIKV